MRGMGRHATNASALGVQNNNSIICWSTNGLLELPRWDSFSSSTSSFTASGSADDSEAFLFPIANHPWHPAPALPLPSTDRSEDIDEALTIQTSHSLPPSTDWKKEDDGWTSSFTDRASADDSEAFPISDHLWHTNLSLRWSSTDRRSEDNDEAPIQPLQSLPPSTDWNEDHDDNFSQSLEFLKRMPMPVDFMLDWFVRPGGN